jgi:hypothetical protein
VAARIAPVIDADLDGPVPWLATAYVAGPSLADAVSQHGPLPPRSVLALAKGLAEGLSAIHAAGVVHRDLKPANVMLAEDGPRVIDFGISRAVEASALTHTGLVVGSPGFMSPEQAEGRVVGPPSDIFSLGAVLAFAATGQGPFGTGSTPALVYRVVHSLPNLDYLPAEVRPLVERCLAKDPAQRPTAAQLLAGAAYPATGWLPEPVTRTFSLDRAQLGAPLTATAARLAPPPTPPLTPLASPPRPGRTNQRAGRHPWRSRWRPLTAAGILARLVGAGVTTSVTITAGSPPAHAAQSVRRDAGVRTGADLSADLRSGRVRLAIARDDRRAEDVQVRARVHAGAEHAAAGDHDPAAEHVAAAQHTPGASADHLNPHHPSRLLGRSTPLAAVWRGSGRRLQHTELVAVGIGQDMPTPAVLADRLAGQQRRAEIQDARDLGLQVGGAQVQMEPVLLALDLRHLLQQHVDPDAAHRRKAAIRAAGGEAGLVAEHGGPELCRTVQVRAVDDDDQFAVRIRLGHDVLLRG